mgnify:FL=1
MFADWSSYATGMGEFVGTKKAFTQRMAKRNFPTLNTTFKSRACRVYKHIRLKFGQTTENDTTTDYDR